MFCVDCGAEISRDTAESAAERLARLPAGVRLIIGWAIESRPGADWNSIAAALREEGFVRAIVGGRSLDLTGLAGFETERSAADTLSKGPCHGIVDRLTAGSAPERLRDSLETAFAKGHGHAVILAELTEKLSDSVAASVMGGRETTIDGRPWHLARLGTAFRCENCGHDYPNPEPKLFSFNSPLGACPVCEGFGSIAELDLELNCSRPRQIDRQRGDRALEHPGLCPRAKGTARAGVGL